MIAASIICAGVLGFGGGQIRPPVSNQALKPPLLRLFNASDDGRGLRNAYICAMLSKASYSREGFHESTKKWGAIREEFHREGSTETEWGIVETPTAVIVAFRGSEMAPAIKDLNDWIYDSNAQMQGGSYWGGGKVHKGFAQCANSVYAKVLPTVKLYAGARKPVWITGHSLGGALATLMAFRLKPLTPNVVGLYTFGAPRVGNKDFRSAFLSKGFTYGRWVNDRDPAPVLPPEWMSFVQIGHMHRIRSDSGVNFNASGNYPFDATQIGDHFMLNYLKAIWRELPPAEKAMLPAPE